MKQIPIRRSRLITTFGPGSLIISPDGETAIVGALDKWFYDQHSNKTLNIEEFEIQEPRLKSLLQVNHLMQPPDYRPSYQFKKSSGSFQHTNPDLYIPMLRFPLWHYCSSCNTLDEFPLSSREGWKHCKKCKRKRKMIQVPFVIICQRGHISDFPWREWLHKNEFTKCEGLMQLKFSGGASLDSLKVACECGSERSLRSVKPRRSSVTDDPKNEVSELSKLLNEKGDLYRCPGHKPWHGDAGEKEHCEEYPFAIFSNAMNVYFPNTISAIHLPGKYDLEVEDLNAIFRKHNINARLLSSVDTIRQKIDLIKNAGPPDVRRYQDDHIELAILYAEGGIHSNEDFSNIEGRHDADSRLRKKEAEVLVREYASNHLKIISEWAVGEPSSHRYADCFELVNRVTRLKQTTALTGFGRLNPEFNQSKTESRKLLFSDPDHPDNDWLPAFEVFGEGIFLTINQSMLKDWLENENLQEYFAKYKRRVLRNNVRFVDTDFIRPENILIHTLSHVIIDELSLTCGYNAAAIQERIYDQEDITGVLIYTSSGDADGTFGGLVRMGKQDVFFPLVKRALEKATWCSSDPVCSEIGKSSGQGIQNYNGAACHSCTHVPETSCEMINLFLDRALLVDPDFGFFSSLLNQS